LIKRNSDCEKCVLEFKGRLIEEKHPITGKDIVICDNCWALMLREIDKDKK